MHLSHATAMGAVMISLPSRHAVFDAKHLLLWLLTALALATFGVEDAQGIHVSDERIGDAAVVSRPPASRDREPLSESMSLNDSNNNTRVVPAEVDQDRGELDVSLCLLLIVRDEAASLRANLPLWIDVADCFVIGIDDRTTDDTPHVIHEVLGGDNPRFVFFYTFEGFAQARNAVLRSTVQNFPDATHVIVADADWRPNLATIDKSELDFVHGSFPFLVHDHTGHTTRVLGWLLRFDEGLRFKYRVHEVLAPIAAVEGESTQSSKVVGWEVQVVESDSNWSSKFHQHSRSSERHRFDLHLLELDYEDDPTDLHTLFYLGITKFAYIESLMGKGTHQKTPELEALVTSAMSYFRQAVDLHGEMENSELVWGSKRWLAYGYQYFVGDAEEARTVYEDCIAYDPTRVDCTAFLSRLYLTNGDLDAAWTTAKASLLHRAPTGRVLDFFYLLECFVPAQAATVISKRISASDSDGLGNDSVEGLLTTGWYLLRHHRDHCDRGVMVDSPEDIDRLEAWFHETIAQEGVNVQEIKRIALLNGEESPLLGGLLRTWGTGSKASTTWSLQARQGPQGQHQEEELQKQPQRHNWEQGSGENEEELDQERTSAADASAVTDGVVQELAESALLSSHPGGRGEQQKDLDERAVGEDDHEADATGGEDPSRGSAVTAGYCEKVVGEARTRLGLGEEMVTGALAATSVAQMDAARTASLGHEQQHFRALVLGGGVGGSAGGRARGLELEELLQVVSLLLQLSSRASSELTYVHPDPSVVQAARSVTSSCADELGINGGQVRLDFACSTPADFLGTTAIDHQFDYVDVGGPLSLRTKDAKNEKVGSASATPAAAPVPDTGASVVLDSATLRLLGHKLAPGAHLKAWAFAANPSTELAFRAAHKAAVAADDNGVQDVGTQTTLDTNQDQAGTGGTTDSLVSKILRKTFRIGQTGAPAKDMVSGTTTVPVPVRAGTVEEEAWARQVSAGGDRLTVSDVAGLLAEGGFELMIVLRKNAAERGEAAAAARAADISEMLEGGLSRWEIADFADSLELTPALVHQVLAVRRDHDWTTTTVT